MSHPLAVITPCYKIILFGFVCFCSNAFAELEEKGSSITTTKHQTKRSIDFPTLFYPGPDNKFITLSPPPVLPEGLTIFVNGHKETHQTPAKQIRTKFKVVHLHQDQKPQIPDWNHMTKGPSDGSNLEHVHEWDVQKVPLSGISTTSPPLPVRLVQGSNMPKKNFSRPLKLKSFAQVRGSPPPKLTPSPRTDQVRQKSFIEFPIIEGPRTLQGVTSEPRFSAGVRETTNNPTIPPPPPPNRIVSYHHRHHHDHHHKSSFDRSNYGVTDQRPNHSNDEREKLAPSKTSSFSCDHLAPGYYADLETRCKVFHICDHGRRHTFVCPSETLFNQQLSVCDWPQRVTCPPLIL